MKIAVLAPVGFPILRNQKYGGIENVIRMTVLGYCSAGHDVTLYAPAGTDIAHRNLHIVNLSESVSTDIRAAEVALFRRLQRDAAAYDIVHSHLEPIIAKHEGSNLLADIQPPIVATMHNQTYIDEHIAYYRQNRAVQRMTFVFISKSQASALPFLSNQRVIYNGIELEQFAFNGSPKHQLVFLGRITPEKGVKEAILIAKRAGIPLIIGAAIHPSQQAHFEQDIAPHLDNRAVTYIGEPSNEQRQDILSSSLAYVFPLKWREPFGLTIVESLACGTPVIAPDIGAVPEIITNGKSGYVVRQDHLLDDSVQAIDRIREIDRHACRREAERFSAKRMIDGYLGLFESLLHGPKA